MSKIEDLKGTLDEAKIDASAIEGPINLHISMPLPEPKVDINTDLSIRQAVNSSLLKDKLNVSQNYTVSTGDMYRVRNTLAAHFMESGAEWQLQIDPGIVFPYGMGPQLFNYYANWMDEETLNGFLGEGIFRYALGMNAIDEILRSGIEEGRRIVGGLYFANKGYRDLRDTSSIIPHDKDYSIEFKIRKDNFIQTDKLAAGFLLVHRTVYEGIQAEFPELKFDRPVIVPGKPSYSYYQPLNTIENKEGVVYQRSEDYSFSWRAQQAGFDPCINMNLLIGHVGQHIYSWMDRPPVQKILLNSLNDQHKVTKG